MARSVTSDFLQSFRFHVIASPALLGTNHLNPNDNAQAGFSAISSPGANIEIVEYREGTYIYTRKQPGIPSMEDITMSRGVALTDTVFYDWFINTLEGLGEYRVDLLIKHFSRERSLTGNEQGLNRDTLFGFRAYKMFNCFPSQHKVASDLDASSSDISITDLTVTYERFEVGFNEEF